MIAFIDDHREAHGVEPICKVLGVLGMLALIAPLSDRLIGGQDAIHRPLRAQVMAFVEQRRHDLRRRTVDEARAGEHIEDLLALGFTQRPGGRWTGLPVPGS